MTGVPYERGEFTPRTLIKLSMHGNRDAQLSFDLGLGGMSMALLVMSPNWNGWRSFSGSILVSRADNEG